MGHLEFRTKPGRYRAAHAERFNQAERPRLFFFLESSFITHSTGRRRALARRPPQGP